MGRPHRQRTQPMVERDLEFDHELEDEAFAGLPPALELRESVNASGELSFIVAFYLGGLCSALKPFCLR